MKKKAKFSIFLVLLIVLGLTYYYQEEIVVFILDNFLIKKETSILTDNGYLLSNNYMYLQKTDNFSPKSRKDIINIYYTALNAGNDTFTFYCPKEYQECLDEVLYISGNQQLLSNINNFVHPFNSFKNLETEYDSTGKVTLKVNHTYEQSEITEINNKVDLIIKEIITEGMTNKDKIKVVHDYIINHSKYDSARSDKKESIYKSNTAYGTLLQGYGICGGYSDAMKIFLDRFGINNYKISSENHVWNLVNLDGKWYHLDLTWDDPVVRDEQGNTTDILEYDYFLITTEELHKIEKEQHNFNEDIYIEAK